MFHYMGRDVPSLGISSALRAWFVGFESDNMLRLVSRQSQRLPRRPNYCLQAKVKFHFVLFSWTGSNKPILYPPLWPSPSPGIYATLYSITPHGLPGTASPVCLCSRCVTHLLSPSPNCLLSTPPPLKILPSLQATAQRPPIPLNHWVEIIVLLHATSTPLQKNGTYWNYWSACCLL